MLSIIKKLFPKLYSQISMLILNDLVEDTSRLNFCSKDGVLYRIDLSLIKTNVKDIKKYIENRYGKITEKEIKKIIKL